MNKSQFKIITAAVVVFLALLFIIPIYSTGKQEAKKIPTLVWFTSVQGGREPAEQPLFEKEVFRLTGVKVKIIKTTEDYNTKLTAMLVSGEPLDIVYIGSSEFEKLWSQHLFEPLTKRIENSPVLSNPNIIPKSEWDRIRRKDGQIYAVFNKFEQGTLPIVRKDWMEKLGIADPNTLDEYYQMLKAFKTQDPDGNGIDDTYGLAIGYTLYDATGIFGAYGLMRGFQKDSSGKLYAPWATKTAIPVYEWFRKLYKEGILEPNFITNKSSNFRNLFMSNKAGMTLYWAAWVGLFNQKVHAENPNSPFKARGLVPPKGPGGRLLRAGGDGLMCIPKTSKYKDEAFKILEFWNTKKGNILSTLGILDYDYKIENGKYVLTDIGKKHAMDHGAPQPKSLEWKNPLGELEGFEEAAAIIRKYAKPQMSTSYDKIWETVVRSEAAKIILGDITPEQGIENMQKRFKEEGVYK
ncbi:MAG: extracellular solute-binding protein [Spirochaetes bacterium]|nr:extracellular solute-binding protein [Spirochaetota bacterium]